MKINLLSIEDNINVLGFRKITSQIKTLNPDTSIHYVTTCNFHSVWHMIFGRTQQGKELTVENIDEIASSMAHADIIGVSSMTGYAKATKSVFRAIRQKNPNAFLVWGGVHPIIHPEDAIPDVDAICTGEGELAFEEFFDLYKNGKDYTNTRNFWFNQNGKIKRNPFRPLQSQSEMDAFPQTYYGEPDELLFYAGKGFKSLKPLDYVAYNGLGYSTIWTIGCPFSCSFCGNTRFIENDPKYRKLRSPSVSYMIEEIQRAKERHPFISAVIFNDDSFMALPTDKLEEFADAWKREIKIPFVVMGVIPNYVRKDKFEILVAAGMNKIRMGVQSGSERILKFYERPSLPAKVLESAKIMSEFKDWMFEPSFDIIMDNPIETKQDLVDTLELLYKLPRPYHLNLFSLKVIPNTRLEKLMIEHNLSIDAISSSYLRNAPILNTVLVNLLAFWRPPRWLFDRLLQNLKPCGEKQKLYPVLMVTMRLLHLAKTGLHHVRYMDFTFIPGMAGWLAWRLGLVQLWQMFFIRKYQRKSTPKDLLTFEKAVSH